MNRFSSPSYEEGKGKGDLREVENDVESSKVIH